VEALAAGLPLLCRADDCLDDLVQDWSNGWQYHTQAEFRHYLEMLLADTSLQNRLSAAAIVSSARYSSIAFAQSVVALYESLISAHATVNRISA
jgi:1,2-diacylglycerol 3-alpha-glucosyltransferase